MRLPFFALAIWLLLAAAAQAAPADLYALHCASCHGATRLGGTGPALLPESLERLRRPDALRTVREGRAATQMPAFQATLAASESQALVDYLYSPAAAPTWGPAEIRASRIEGVQGKPGDRPVYAADPLNLFIVVETGDHHATLLDGDRLEPITRFPTRYALHGGPKYSPDGRYVYFASRDGWITKYDLYRLRVVAEIRAGLNTRNLAISDDGKYVLVGNTLPRSLAVLDARDLSLLRHLPVVDAQGRPSRVSAVYQAAPRHSFVIALKDAPEVWELPYTMPAEEPWVHDHGPMTDELKVDPARRAVRRIPVEDVLDDFFFDPTYRYLIGAGRAGKGGQVLDLDTGKKVADLALTGMPHLGSGITWEYQGRPVLATPDLKEAVVTVIDMVTWQTLKKIPTQGPGMFMRSHEHTPYAWVDVFNGTRRDTMQLLDKRTLEITQTLVPAPGKVAAHTEFTRDGRFALVSIWEQEGELVVYDTATLQVVKRLPMKKPSGKYNVFNKTTRSSGTSH